MGLAAPKRRNKLSADPNNTAWSKSDTSYGHKILSAQGWKPGDYLGAENAMHSDHFTAANASHIKVLLREDNLGLGAQVGKGNAETFGLSLFSSVLGRLNGKSEAEVQKQQNAVRDAELRSYQTNKHGFMNFVSGGLLVGDEIKPVEMEHTGGPEKKRVSEEDLGEDRKAKRRKRDLDSRQGNPPENAKKTKAKRRPERDEDEQPSKEHDEGKTKIQQPEERDISAKVPSPVEDSLASGVVKDHAVGPEPLKKRDSKGSRRKKEGQTATANPVADSTSDSKHEKRARKEERRKRKEEKRQSKSELHKEVSVPANPAIEQGPRSSTSHSVPTSGNRHAVRQRYIQQKRMAALDPQAMKEIFMVTGTA